MESYRCGLVALSADPITFGHMDLIARVKERCASVVVLIADNDMKRGEYLFSLPERVHIATRAVAQSGLSDIRVIGSGGLLVDTYLREGCDVLFRGIRDHEDERYESRQMQLHTLILPDLVGHIVFLESREEYRLVSSSLVKAFVRSGIDVSSFVPSFVKQLLEERICGQYKIAVTGCQAHGKTYVAEQLARRLCASGVSTHLISIDILSRELYGEDSPGAQFVRDGIAGLFGEEMLIDGRKNVRRDALKRRIFASETKPEERESLHRLVAPHIDRLYREAVSGKRGIVLVEWAQLAEMKLSHWTNHHSIVVSGVDRGVFRSTRAISSEDAETMSRFQWNAEEKARSLYDMASLAGNGTVIRFVNRIGDTASLDSLAHSVRELFPSLRYEGITS